MSFSQPNATTSDHNLGWRLRRIPFAVVASLIGILSLANTIHAQPTKALIYEGFTEAHQDVLVSASELGMLARIHVKMGDHVKAGQILAELEDSQQQAVVRISRVQSQMTGDLDLAIAEERMYRDKTETLRQMLADGLARPDELERSETNWLMAQARVTQAREQQALRKLQLKRDELQLARRRIVAPIDGVIARVLHQRGEYLTPADSNVFQLLGVETLDAVFNIPVEDLDHVQVEMPVRVFLRSRSETVEALIDQVSPSIEGRSGTVQIRVRIDNADGKFLHGDRCTLRLVPGAKTRPMEAVRSRESASEISPADETLSAPHHAAQNSADIKSSPMVDGDEPLPPPQEFLTESREEDMLGAMWPPRDKEFLPPSTIGSRPYPVLLGLREAQAEPTGPERPDAPLSFADLLRSVNASTSKAGQVESEEGAESMKQRVASPSTKEGSTIKEKLHADRPSRSISRAWLQERTRAERRSR